jgi:rare lipoprotein A
MTRKDYTVVVRINDRGPQNPEWEFDISEGAAEALRIKSLGIAKVQWEIIG